MTQAEQTDGSVPQQRPSHATTRPELSRDERAAIGQAARTQAPLQSQGALGPADSRDPVGLLLEQARSRLPELVPVRHSRMLASPFSYFRGAALPMAADLAQTPTSGLRVQLCGDAHLANFGAYASPERRLVFDLNDFDETLPGPVEWDVKRLAASLAVAGRDRGFSDKERRKIVLTAATTYRESVREFAGMTVMDVWYARLDVEDALERFRGEVKASRLKATEALLAKARTRDSTQALTKLTTVVDGQRRIVSSPPLVVPVEELFPDIEAELLYTALRDLLKQYARSLEPNRRHLLSQFQLLQVARKVVGVGSIGTRAWIMLLAADDGAEPLFLQAKEAQASVLTRYAGRSKHTNQGQRVVTGQRLMQATSDIFLGWQRVVGMDDVPRDHYVRQLRDWKLSAPIEQMIPAGMAGYAKLCAWTLARAHARTGDRVAIAAYLGRSDKFAHAIADFAEAYADLNERDHAALAEAVKSGRTEAAEAL
jgi:uncharacterized protein (DUF2252 family)